MARSRSYSGLGTGVVIIAETKRAYDGGVGHEAQKYRRLTICPLGLLVYYDTQRRRHLTVKAPV